MALRPSVSKFGPTATVSPSGIGAVVFMIFVAAGCAYIIAAKLGGIEPFYVTFVPVAHHDRLRAADLVWREACGCATTSRATISITWGSCSPSRASGSRSISSTPTRAAEEIVQNFGIAIGSTITGIALRVMFNQMRRDPVEVERDDAARAGRSGAPGAARARQHAWSSSAIFRRNAQQAAADSFDHMPRRSTRSSSRLLASVADVALQLARSARGRVAPLGRHDRRGCLQHDGGDARRSRAQLAAEMETLSQSVVEIARTHRRGGGEARAAADARPA